MTRDSVNGWFSKAMNSGLVATIAWFIVLVLYSVFQWKHIDAPGLNEAFLLLTGGWVGMLTLAQSKKNQEMANDVETQKVKTQEVEQKVQELARDSDAIVKRADASETREQEWSRHKDHHEGGEE